MILAERYYSVDNVDYLLSQNSIFSTNLIEAVKIVKSFICDSSPMAYLKDTINGHFVELKHVNGVVEASYLLDLFDFQKEFFEKVQITAHA